MENIFNILTKSDLEEYAQVLFKHFSQMYNKSGEFFQIDIYFVDQFVAMQFKLVESCPVEIEKIRFIPDKDIDYIINKVLLMNITQNSFSKELNAQMELKGFQKDFFFTIKENLKDKWHKSNAHKDIAEFMGAIRSASIKKMVIDEALLNH